MGRDPRANIQGTDLGPVSPCCSLSFPPPASCNRCSGEGGRHQVCPPGGRQRGEAEGGLIRSRGVGGSLRDCSEDQIWLFLVVPKLEGGAKIREAGSYRPRPGSLGLIGVGCPAGLQLLAQSSIFPCGLAWLRVHSSFTSHRALGLPCARLLPFCAACGAQAPEAVPTPAKSRLCTCSLICPSKPSCQRARPCNVFCPGRCCTQCTCG